MCTASEDSEEPYPTGPPGHWTSPRTPRPKHPTGPDTGTFTFTSKTRPANVPPGDYYVCTTDYCEAEGTFVSSVLSETTKPCDDFYDHVCNKFPGGAHGEPAERRYHQHRHATLQGHGGIA
ncbi:hypothetical protein MRX96_034102 [Rhipicephalus microplus]